MPGSILNCCGVIADDGSHVHDGFCEKYHGCEKGEGGQGVSRQAIRRVLILGSIKLRHAFANNSGLF